AVTVPIIVADILAPEKGRRAAGARCIFPLRFGEETIGLVSYPGEPRHISLRVLPTHEDDRSRAAAPAGIAGWALGAATGRNARVPIGKCHRELGHGDWVGEDDPMLRTLVDIVAFFPQR